MRCLGWRFLQFGGEWSCLHSCYIRWHPVNAHITWVQVWEGD